ACACVEDVVALEAVPAEVRPAQRAVGLAVDLLRLVLPHVADHDPATVEREPERVSQAEREDLVAPPPAHEGVRVRHPIALAVALRADSKKLAEELVWVLRVAGLVARPSTV